MVAVFSCSQLKINSLLFSTRKKPKKQKPVVKQSPLTGIFTKIYFVKNIPVISTQTEKWKLVGDHFIK